MTTPSVNPNKALWEKGDFTRIADTMRESGDEFVVDSLVDDDEVTQHRPVEFSDFRRHFQRR